MAGLALCAGAKSSPIQDDICCSFTLRGGSGRRVMVIGRWRETVGQEMLEGLQLPACTGGAGSPRRNNG